jgi:single-strand DNA-binding protein
MANFNFNKIMIGGRLTADPENSQTPSGVSVTKISVAVNRKAKEQQTDFFNVTAWRGTADFVSKYFKKGSSIFIVGTLQNRSWTDQNGQKRYATDIVAEEVSFVDGKNDNAGADFPEANNAPKLDVVPEGEDLPF